MSQNAAEGPGVVYAEAHATIRIETTCTATVVSAPAIETEPSTDPPIVIETKIFDEGRASIIEMSVEGMREGPDGIERAPDDVWVGPSSPADDGIASGES